MPINNITQTISELPAAGRRGVDVQTQFVIKQEDFQDHLQGTTVTELNTLKDQLNSRIGEINSTTTTMNEYATTASTGASTATTKAGEASTSASGALTSKNQASTFATNSSNSATKSSQWADNNYNVAVEAGKYSAKHWSVVAENAVGDTVKLTGNQTITGTKTFSSNIAGSITGNAGTATKLATAISIALAGDVTGNASFDGSANVNITTTVNYASSAGTANSATSITYNAAAWGNAQLPVGEIGTYAFLYFVGSLNPSDNVAGSSLFYSDTDSHVATSAAGTWKCMGRITNNGSTVFLRIA